MNQPAAQPNPARDDAIDLEIAVELQPRFDVGEARDQVGPFGIADDEVADLLDPQAHAVKVRAGGHAAPLELALEEGSSNRAPLDPHPASLRRNQRTAPSRSDTG